jgi:hypothetical protein
LKKGNSPTFSAAKISRFTVMGMPMACNAAAVLVMDLFFFFFFSDAFSGCGNRLGFHILCWFSHCKFLSEGHHFGRILALGTLPLEMEVVNENAALLSNYDVFSLLTDLQAGENGQKKPNKFLQNLATISYETIKCLEKTPCKDQSPEIIEKFMKSLVPYNLSKAEKLQLLNHRPTAAVEIQLLIEESEERLTEDQIEELLQLVADCLIPESPENEEDDEDEEMIEDS